MADPDNIDVEAPPPPPEGEEDVPKPEEAEEQKSQAGSRPSSGQSNKEVTNQQDPK